ncbi:MAG: sulfatase-like hydrolase/transferase [Thioalkalispiraceae bacterium]|jgi:phosphoglycerol transferase MdoB-like AlkP superfamily enzyme
MQLITFTQHIPRLFRLILSIVLLTLLILSALRLIFWFAFDNPADPVPGQDLLYAFYLGLKFDLRLTLYVLLPLFLLGWIKWLSPFYNRLTHHLWLSYLVLAATGVLLIYLVDFGHFAYLHRRIDATVLRFVQNFSTSAQMVWQTYAVIPWTLLVIGLIALDAYVVHRVILFYRIQSAPVIKRRHKFWIAPFSFFIVIFAMFGKFSYYPLRWSDAFFSPHAYASSLASNPVLYFFNTVKNKEVVYDENKTREYYAVVSQYLGVTEPDKQRLNYRRHVPSQTASNPPPNIVMVFLESYAAYKSSAFGNKLKSTPNFDKLEREGLSFTRYFTPHWGTARSVFAAITGIPDIEVNKTSSRNPLVVDQHTIINDFKNYEKFYFIGGSANWGNIRGILQHNIRGLRLYEEGSYTKPRMDVWGIDDASLFIEANWVLRKQDEPFFAIIQTAGNHGPYHIPAESYGFEPEQVDIETLRKHGFTSNMEYNAFRFMDHSIGYFMRAASKEAYFDNTIFVFFGDHGISGYPGEHGDAYLNNTNLSGMFTPLVIYAPQLVKPRRIDKIASELDLLPTIAGLAGIEYTNTTLGRDLLDPQFDDRRYAFTIEHNKISKLGLLGNEFYFTMMDNGKNASLVQLQGADSRINVLEQHQVVADKMQQLTFALYETSKYMLHHNKPDQ